MPTAVFRQMVDIALFTQCASVYLFHEFDDKPPRQSVKSVQICLPVCAQVVLEFMENNSRCGSDQQQAYQS